MHDNHIEMVNLACQVAVITDSSKSLQDISEAKQAGLKLREELMERDKAMQQHTSEVMHVCGQASTLCCRKIIDRSHSNLQIQTLGQQLRALDRKSGHQHSEIVDLQTQLHSAQVRIECQEGCYGRIDQSACHALWIHC